VLLHNLKYTSRALLDFSRALTPPSGPTATGRSISGNGARF
jgi:hypothetical protein